MRIRVLAIVVAALAIVARDARAEIVMFKNGRTMSVKSCRVDAETAVIVLRQGGEVTFPSSMIGRIVPDEVPYPDPADGSSTGPATAKTFVVAMLSDDVLASRPFAELISTVAAANQMDARLVHAVIEQESNYQARARSSKGAKGLMQLMPDTARQYGVRNSYDPKANVEAGVRYLKDLMTRLDLPTALAAYNAGEATVKRYGGLPPFPETQTYVRSILNRLGLPRSN